MNFIFPEILGIANHPNWRTHIFQRGGLTTNQIRISWDLMEPWFSMDRFKGRIFTDFNRKRSVLYLDNLWFPVKIFSWNQSFVVHGWFHKYGYPNRWFPPIWWWTKQPTRSFPGIWPATKWQYVAAITMGISWISWESHCFSWCSTCIRV